MEYDNIIIGAGMYGLYAAWVLAKQNKSVLVLEKDNRAFSRATYINQARVHMGYHYPRSYATAIKSAGYFERFYKDFGFAILSEFDQIYATSSKFSWTNAKQFKKFCKNANIMCEEVTTSRYFKPNMCDGAFLTKEYTYDANLIKEYFLAELEKYPKVKIQYQAKLDTIQKQKEVYEITLEDKTKYQTKFLLNCTYAGANEVIEKLGYEKFNIKYELCEIILCEVANKLKNTGITVMDGPFFSIMPFGKTGYHSLTSVTFTPHKTSYESLPTFECQEKSNGFCTPYNLGNCNDCKKHPQTAWAYMSNLTKKYLKEEYGFTYKQSLFSMKPIFKASEIDDSRPTIIRKYTTNPTFISVLSGKINTIYDLDEVLEEKN